MSEKMWIILGMMLVTYIPRILPFYMFRGKKLPDRVALFLAYVPYAALGALILPGIFTSVEGHPIAATAGFLMAVLYSYFRGGIIISVIGSMVTVFLVLLI